MESVAQYREVRRLTVVNTEKGGMPIPWTGKRKYRKRHGRGSGNMLSVRYYEVAPSRYCCHGHDHIDVDKGSARQRERVQWLREWEDEQHSELEDMFAFDSWE